MDVTITVTVNGITKDIVTDSERSILEALREDLRDTGSGLRCGQMRCGGCVVLLDGKRVLACGTPIIKADRCTLTSV